MNRSKAFAWVPFSSAEDSVFIEECRTWWGPILNPQHLIINDDMNGWRLLIRTTGTTLYILGHGAPGDGNIYSGTNIPKTPAQIHTMLHRNLNYGNGLHASIVSKIKFYQCHGGGEDGPAHEFKKMLTGSQNNIEVFGYTETVYAPSHNAHDLGRKYAGPVVGVKRASSTRFEVQHNYTDTVIKLNLDDTPVAASPSWKCCS